MNAEDYGDPKLSALGFPEVGCARFFGEISKTHHENKSSVSKRCHEMRHASDLLAHIQYLFTDIHNLRPADEFSEAAARNLLRRVNGFNLNVPRGSGRKNR